MPGNRKVRSVIDVCHSKRRYQSQLTAKAAAQVGIEVSKNKKNRKPINLGVYMCLHCCGWHLYTIKRKSDTIKFKKNSAVL